jgi:hypothetical protein
LEGGSAGERRRRCVEPQGRQGGGGARRRGGGGGSGGWGAGRLGAAGMCPWRGRRRAVGEEPEVEAGGVAREVGERGRERVRERAAPQGGEEVDGVVDEEGVAS